MSPIAGARPIDDEARHDVQRERLDDEGSALPLGISDDDLALLFADRHASELRYVAAWDRWLVWDGVRWAQDERRRVYSLARKLCRDVVVHQLENPTLTLPQRKEMRRRLGSAQTNHAVVRLASCDERLARTVVQLDADPWLLNTPAGVLDLKTGELRQHDPNELHTKVTAAAIGGQCPLFLTTLERVLPDPEVRDYLQRLAGYGMVGSAREHCLSFWWGTGRNAKGTIAHAMRRALGGYGLAVDPALLMESHHDRHPTELANLRGARFVVASEIDTGRKWNEARLKRLTGGDPVSARYIAKDLFEFETTHTVIVIGNNKPGLRSIDEAIRSRMHLIAFTVTIPEAERDPTVPERLEAEYGGILAWMLTGCLDWQAQGLQPPAAVKAATENYLAAEDSLGSWLEECCVRHGQITLKAAFRSYGNWCESNGAATLGRNTFADQLESRGFIRSSDGYTKSPVFSGLSLPIAPDSRYPD